MRAVRLFAPGDIRCVDVPIPELGSPDEVIIKVKACGVCGSDIMRVMEKGAYSYPITIGHEFAGEVVEVGDKVKTAKPGDRVTVMPLVPCGRCPYCRIGEYVMCDNYDYYGSRIDGAMAEYIRVHNDNILAIPDEVDWQAAAMTDPASVALHGVRKAPETVGHTAVVFGLGAIGLLTVQWLKHLGCRRVFAVDIFDDKLQLAGELGADATVNGRQTDPLRWLLEQTGGAGCDIVVELAGNNITQAQAIAVVKKRGKVIFCGISYDDLVIPAKSLSHILRGEISIQGAWNSSIAPLPINEWGISLASMAAGKLIMTPLISHRFELEECLPCFEMMYKRAESFNKVMFFPEGC